MADSELQELTELTAVATTDVLYVVDDPSGTPLSRKVTKANLLGNLVTKTGTYTIVANDGTIICDATSGAFTVTLPTAVSVIDKIYSIKKIDSSSNAVTVDGDGSETIDDGTTAVLNTQYECITVQSDGSEWWII